MRNLLVIGLFLVSIGYVLPARAQGPLWSNDFGTELPVVSNCDDCQEPIALPFSFPFNGSNFNMAYVGSNGCIQLGGLGSDVGIDYDYWRYMEDFLSDSDPDNPLICPFETDLDTSDSNDCGSIFYNDSGNPLIITWNHVCAHDNFNLLATFQILLYEDGRIVLSYNSIGLGEDLLSLEQGIVVGVTPSDFPYNDEEFVPGDPGPVNLIQGPFDFGPTAYERWCYNEANSCGVNDTNTGLPGPVNPAFDLDDWSICYTPNASGFFITSGFQRAGAFSCSEVEAVTRNIPTVSEWGLIAMAGILGIVGFIVVKRRKVAA